MFIVIEGADGSGKETQSKLLIQKLKKEKHKVTLFDFPQYEKSFFGNVVGKMLAGKFGNMENIDPHIASLPYAMDRWQASEKIKSVSKKQIALANRFTLSNLAHQTARISPNKRRSFIRFILEMENKVLEIPTPDLYIYLDVPVEISKTLIEQKLQRKYLGGNKKDLLEADLTHQLKAAKMYKKLSSEMKNIIRINCCDKNNKLLTKEEIHELVWDHLLTFLK